MRSKAGLKKSYETLKKELEVVSAQIQTGKAKASFEQHNLRVREYELMLLMHKAADLIEDFE